MRSSTFDPFHSNNWWRRVDPMMLQHYSDLEAAGEDIDDSVSSGSAVRSDSTSESRQEMIDAFEESGMQFIGQGMQGLDAPIAMIEAASSGTDDSESDSVDGPDFVLLPNAHKALNNYRMYPATWEGDDPKLSCGFFHSCADRLDGYVQYYNRTEDLDIKKVVVDGVNITDWSVLILKVLPPAGTFRVDYARYVMTIATITPGSADHFDDLFNYYNKWKSLETAFGAWKTLRGSVGGSWSDGFAENDVYNFQLKVKAMGAWKRDTYAEDLHGMYPENKVNKKVFDAWRLIVRPWWTNLPAGDPNRNPEELGCSGGAGGRGGASGDP